MNNAMTISILLLLSFLTSSCNEINQKQQKINNSRSLSNRTDTTQAPNGIVRTVKQDRRGNIWIASWKGVFRYDGKSFTNITADVSTARFFAVLEDKKGNFWLTSIGSGVYYYDGKSFRNFTTKDGLAGNKVTEIYADKAGHVWFCTDAGASRYDGKSFKNFTAKDGLSSNSVNSIMEDKTGKLWFGTSDDACVYDGKTYTVLKHEGKSFKNVRSIIADKNGNIWLGGNDGLWRYDGTTFTNYTRQFVGYIYEDKNGNIWTSSDSIVNRDFKHVSQPPTKTKSWILSRYNSKSLSDSSTPPEIIRSGEALIFGITEANDGSIWFGTLNGVHRYKGNSFTNFKTK
ncbi:ligand-binding sensor domain-containing protein [Sphingobacterium zeae]|uniref:Ligand-binding sensor domain-containing protein n=1 Tax=Sphingobacterium zeae TaxID=1776859 RepID=A0ABU0U3Y2_9SPHI|nr:two-component regulator propeller domain-containing protein [Sphingobacterium zeae]MDQ1149656.1 ligand-binding sensor domain-containing protein [Sphingobacterium zeae]